MKRNKIIGLLLIITAIIIPIYNHKIETNYIVLNAKEVDTYINKTTNNNSEIEISKDEGPKYDYIAVLEIPSISLKRGLVSMTNPYNDIKYNIAILGGTMPDISKTNLILASHNGSSNVSFFKDLESLSLNEKIYLYYNGYKYIYELSNIYTVNKTGEVNISRDINHTTLTLITCKNNSDTEQLVFIAYLIDKEVY